MSSLQHVIGLSKSVITGALLSRDFAFVAHNDIDVAQSVHLVDAVLLAQVVKFAVKSTQQAQNILRLVLVCLVVLVETNQTAVTYGYIVQDVNDL